MNSSRRLFLAQASIAAGVAVLKKRSFTANLVVRPAATANGNNAIAVFHTNNLNSQTREVYKNHGGLRQIKAQLQHEKSADLLLDAGSFVSNRHSAERQKNMVRLMNETGYSAAAISGLDFSGDQQQPAELIHHMQFPLINCNHRFSTALKPFIKPYQVFKSGNIRIGVTGVCLPVKGAVYADAVECANRTARFLKQNEHCHLVICMSDLGPGGQQNELNDQQLAFSSEHIDIIIGNDYGKLQNNDRIFRNKVKGEVVFSAASAKGLTIGYTEVAFNELGQKHGLNMAHIIPRKPAGQNFGAALRELSIAVSTISVS